MNPVESLDEAIHLAIGKWCKEDIPLLPGAEEADIRRIEKAYSITLPWDLRAYFQVTMGMDCSEFWPMDKDMLTFWRLPSVEDVETKKETPGYIAPLPQVVADATGSPSDLVIGDWSILAFWFFAAISSDHGAPTQIYYGDGEQAYCVGETFEDFLRAYVARGLDAFWSPDTTSGTTKAEQKAS